jgi:hypothetical protein
MLSEEVNEWGIPQKPVSKKISPERPRVSQEEAFTPFEDVQMTIRYLSEVVEPERFEVISSSEEEPGVFTLKVRLNAGNLSSIVQAAQDVADQEDEDLESVLNEILDLSQIEKELDRQFWDLIRASGNFSGSRVEITGYPQKPSDFKKAQFEFEFQTRFEHPDTDHSIEEIVKKVLKNSMKWWV